MKTLMLVLIVACLTSACTTVRTYDKDGNLLGWCRVSGFTKKGGQCIGHANGEGGK